MIAVVGKRTAGLEYGAFSHDLIPLDHGGGAILIDENPFSAQQGNGGLSQVANGHEIYEGMQVSSLNGRLFLVALVVSINILGDFLRDVFNPRLR